MRGVFVVARGSVMRRRPACESLTAVACCWDVNRVASYGVCFGNWEYYILVRAVHTENLCTSTTFGFV